MLVFRGVGLEFVDSGLKHGVGVHDVIVQRHDAFVQIFHGMRIDDFLQSSESIIHGDWDPPGTPG